MKIDRQEWNEIAAEMLHMYAWDNYWIKMFGDAFPAFECIISRHCDMLVEHIFQQVYFEDVPIEAFQDDYEATRSFCYELMCDYSESFEPMSCILTPPLDSYPNARQVCENLYNKLYSCIEEMQGEHLANLSDSDAQIVMRHKEKK